VIRLLLILFLLFSALPGNSQIVINEVCPANADLIHDPEFFNFSGWVELHNTGNSTASVSGFFLSDDADQKNKWAIPSGTTIPGRGFLLIWCDERDSRLHTNFSLDSDGEELILSNAGLAELDRIAFPVQYTNIAYGRTSDGGSTWAYLPSPTPRATNKSQKASQRLVKPDISLKSGRYATAQSVSISHTDPNASIRFTLDGSEPNSGSALYSNPISVTKTTTIKAMAFREGFLPGESEVKTFFINEHPFTLPVVSISTKPDYLWHNQIGIYTNGTNGVPGNCQSDPFNWNQDWSRHAVIEFFDPDGDKQFDQDVDIRIGGACSRGFPQKSFVIKARDKYGKNTIDEDLFSSKQRSSYGGFMLRNSGNDFWNTMFRDALMQSLVIGQMDVDYLAYQPKIFYLNGAYWGVQNLREKIDADYFETNYGIDKNDLDLGEGQSALEGSIDGFHTYLYNLDAMDPASPGAFDYINSNIDVQEFINYQVAEIYYANTDWPGNNLKFWRQRSGNGKWRWVLWDLDFGFGLYNGFSYPTHPTMTFVTEENAPGWPNPPWSTRHLRLLLRNPEFRTRFIQTLTTSLSTTFKPERVIDFIDSFQERLQAEMPYHTARWNMSVGGWNNEVQRLRDFAQQRNDFMKGHIASFFGLADQVKITLASNPAGAGGFDFNGISVKEALSETPYFRDLGFTIAAVPETGYKFSHWNIQKREITTVPLVERGSSWKYFDQGFEPAPEWSQDSFGDNTWPEGPAQFGYGEGDEITLLSYGGDQSNKFITSYFRKSINVPDTTNFNSLSGKILFDDGVVVYLNGQEIFRSNMPEGDIVYTSYALGAATENVYTSFTIPKGMIRPGSNVIAVELHQNSAASSDTSFDLELGTVKLGDEESLTSNEISISGLATSNIRMEAVFEVAQPKQGIVINEFSAIRSQWLDEKNEAEDWIEILNTGTEAVDLAGLYITDNPGNKTKYQIPAGANGETIVEPGAYAILWADETLTDGPLHVNLRLSGDGEFIGLYQRVGADLLLVDEIAYAGYNSISSYSRIPNGVGPFLLTGQPTPLAENQFELPVSIPEPEEYVPDIFPNPTRGEITITTPGVIDKIMIYTTSGKLIKHLAHRGPRQAISLADLQAGIYIVMIKSGDRVFTRRVAKF